MYSVIELIGHGGNATVSKVTNDEGNECALKQLHQSARNLNNKNKKHEEMRARFIDEIDTINNNFKEIEGIIPILDYSKDDFWYTMPIAKSVVEYIKESSATPSEIVIGIIDICDTLFKLHEKNISHRDIKPSNIYFFHNRYYLGDFGLVDLPDNENNLTRSDRGLGAIFTIAPEMKRNPKDADGKKADVYSLAKTLWMLLTLDETGFDGTYDFFDPKHSLNSYDKLKGVHIVELEKILQAATNNTPENRPTISEFKDGLLEWLEIENDYNKSQKSDWKFFNDYILKSSGDSVVWRNREDIVEVLNYIAKLPAHNHMLYSSGGGQDFVNSSLAPEDECIYISDDCTKYNIVRPKALYFERFKDNEEWNYLFLECDDLSPIISNEGDYERLVEDYPAHYVSAQYSQYGVYDYDSGEQLPEGYKVVYRYNKGKFLFVLKSGPYNGITGTYDGRHGRYSNQDFREYICDLMNSKNGYSKDFKAEGISLKRKAVKKSVTWFSAEKFLKKNYTNLFIDIDSYAEKSSNAAFYISLQINDGLFMYFEEICLCIDGHFQAKQRDDLTDVKLIYSREEAFDCLEKCKNSLSIFCRENGFEDISSYFSINIIKQGKPNHMFSKDEIEVVMRNADDRQHNILVINEDGFVEIVHDGIVSHTYPVRHSSWNAGNRYVGKYSSLETLEDDYISSLQGWLFYLNNGKSIKMDYVHDERDEKLLLEKIKSFY